MPDGEGMIWAWPFEQFLKVVWGTLGGLSTPLTVGGGHEQALMPLLVLLLAGIVGGAFISVLVSLCLAFEMVKDCSDCLLARGKVGGDVKELLGGSQTFTSQLMK